MSKSCCAFVYMTQKRVDVCVVGKLDCLFETGRSILSMLQIFLLRKIDVLNVLQKRSIGKKLINEKVNRAVFWIAGAQYNCLKQVDIHFYINYAGLSFEFLKTL